MRISEFAKQLEQILKEFGDLEVCVERDSGEGEIFFRAAHYVSCAKTGKPTDLIICSEEDLEAMGICDE